MNDAVTTSVLTLPCPLCNSVRMYTEEGLARHLKGFHGCYDVTITSKKHKIISTST